MRRRISIISLLIVVGICIFGYIGTKKEQHIKSTTTSTMLDEVTNRYKKNTEEFVPISAKELLNEDNQKPFLLYVGRATCPHCQEFVQELSKASKKTGKTVYYLDSENAAHDEELQEVGKKYNIEAVPTLLNISKHKESKKYAGESIDELEQWMKLTDG